MIINIVHFLFFVEWNEPKTSLISEHACSSVGERTVYFTISRVASKTSVRICVILGLSRAW